MNDDADFVRNGHFQGIVGRCQAVRAAMIGRSMQISFAKIRGAFPRSRSLPFFTLCASSQQKNLVILDHLISETKRHSQPAHTYTNSDAMHILP
jgi:hypothetical protein